MYTAAQKTDTEATLNLLAAQRYPDEIHVGKRLALNAVHMSCIARSQYILFLPYRRVLCEHEAATRVDWGMRVCCGPLHRSRLFSFPFLSSPFIPGHNLISIAEFRRWRGERDASLMHKLVGSFLCFGNGGSFVLDALLQNRNGIITSPKTV